MIKRRHAEDQIEEELNKLDLKYLGKKFNETF